MLEIKATVRFDKDFKKAKKQGKNMELLLEVVRTLAQEKPLGSEYKDHQLKGKYQDYRECHIGGRKSDWLLIYKIERDELILKLMRTGSHQSLFNEDVLQGW